MSNLIIKFLLLFCKIEYGVYYNFFKYQIEYKKLFNKVYLFNEYVLPPTHQMCRCRWIDIKASALNIIDR
jgi:hypothetical protein